MAAPLTPSFKTKMNIGSKMIFVRSPATVAYKGVFVSLNPRKTPCTAKDRRTAGEPNDLNVKYFSAGFSIGEPWSRKFGFFLVHFSSITMESLRVVGSRHLQVSHPSHEGELLHQKQGI